MIQLTLDNQTFLTFKTLKEFNRWSKRVININFKSLIDQQEDVWYTITLINYKLSWSTQFKLSII